MGASVFPNALAAEDIQQFKLTDLYGTVSIRNYSDKQHYTSTGSQPQYVDSEIRELEVDVQGKAYVYHPNFLKLDFGGGPVIQPGGNYTYNFNARLNFLEKKPYPFSVFFERRNPLIVSGIDEQFIQRNTKYGVNGVLKEWKYPIFANFEAYHLTSHAQGTSQLINDELSNVNMRLSQTNKSNGSRQLFIQTTKQSSASGPIGAGIVPTEIDALSVNYDEVSTLGIRGEYSFKNVFNYMERNYIRGGAADISLAQFHYSPILHWVQSEKVRMFYQLDILKSEQSGTNTDNKIFRMGYKRVDENDGGKSAEFQFQDNETNGHAMDSRGVSGVMHTSREFGGTLLTKDRPKKAVAKPRGKAVFKAALGYQSVDRTSGQGDIPDNELLVMSGISEAKLKRNNAHRDSIVVWNSGRNVQYVLDVDYTVVVRGNETYLLRVVGGNIADGETVQVDYTYTTGGTFSHTSLDQQLQMSLEWQNSVSMFAGISRNEVDVTSGTPGIDIGSSEHRNAGVIVNHKVNEELAVGVDARLDQQKNGIAPHRRKSLSAFAQYQLFNATYIRLSANSAKVDYEISAADVDLLRYNVTVNTRAFSRSNIFFSYVLEEDAGAGLPRYLSDYIVKWQWSYRSLYFTLNARKNRETQKNTAGEVKKKRELFRATLERRF